MKLSRELLESGYFQELARTSNSPNQVAPLSDQQLDESLAQARAMAPEDGQIWVFGYGSLIWNPLFDYDQSTLVTLYGYRRQFCLQTELGRGSPGNPGLVLGLVPGGCCRGMAFRLSQANVDKELQLLWRREMVTGAYRPRWLTLRGDGQIRALTFVMNRDYRNYVEGLSDEQKAQMLAHAAGPLGTSADYLLNTHEGLCKIGINDTYLTRLASRVNAIHRKAD